MAHIIATVQARPGYDFHRHGGNCHFEMRVDFDNTDFENSAESFMVDGEEISRRDVPQYVMDLLAAKARTKLQALGVQV